MKVILGPYNDDNSPREISVQIDPYDTWGMDSTLALIILPMLKQLKETRHGSFDSDDEDVPEELRSTTPKTDDTPEGDNIHRRCDWILDQMIWSFDKIHPDNEDEFYMNTLPNKEAYQVYQEKLQNGLRLFGKYYTGLWD